MIKMYSPAPDAHRRRFSLQGAVLVTLLITGLLAGCAAGDPQLSGTSWNLAAYGPSGNLTAAAPDVETSLAFDPDGQVSGNMGCNTFGGSFQEQGGKVTFEALASTLMACDEVRMQQEGAVLGLLSGEMNFSIDGSRLTLTSAAGDQVVVLEKQ